MDLRLSEQASRFLNKCETILAKRIIKKIDELKVNQFNVSYKKLSSLGKEFYRIRVGDYRIIYKLDIQNNEIFVEKIDKRSKIYKIKDEDMDENSYKP
jgi:mRNA interferase RelE/StbE